MFIHCVNNKFNLSDHRGYYDKKTREDGEDALAT